jgi:hypothetical protein
MFTNYAVEAANTFKMTWSSQTFGPDGPWQAVEIRVGSRSNVVSLYPGGIFSSHILSPSVCTNATLGTVCYAQTAGLYDSTLSSTSEFGSISVTAGVDYSEGALQMGGTPGRIGTDTWDIGNSMETLREMNMAVHDSIWGTLLDGTTYPLSVGSLALGAPGTVNQTFTFGTGQPAINATLLPGWLAMEAAPNKILSSNSYGLHIGSVSPKISPSLYFGGFDQNRVLGTVSIQQGSPDSVNSIDMLDISLTVVEGASPWTFSNLGGLLASGNSSINDILPISVNSLAPYLHLPKSTCDAIAAKLPVTYQSKYGLYFWNTDDPQYEKIVSSPSCLSFTFRESQSGNNFTINVPFKLLNLTLTAPLTTTPTAYFPCKVETQTHYQLGRAFLQAAFVGVNWNAYNGSAAWWLAQAPGPNTPSQVNVLVVGDTDTTITGSSSDWASTWRGYWNALPTETVGNSTTSTSTPKLSSGLSTGAKVGIGIGVPVGVITVLVASFFFWKKSRKPSPPDYATESQPAPGFQPSMSFGLSGTPPAYRHSGFKPVEIEARPEQRYELQT